MPTPSRPRRNPRLAPAASAALAALALLAGCAAKRIPGTQIPDNSDTRAVVALIDAYRVAAEQRDAQAVLALVSPSYYDDAGTPEPSDDVDRAGLERRLAADYAQITSLRMDIAVRRIEIEGARAAAYVYYEERYRITTRAGEVAKQASDLHRMRFAKEGGSWKFTSGL